MLTANRDLMKQAREALKGNWGLAVAGNLIYMVMFALGQFIPIVKYAASLILGGPLLLGVAVFFLALGRKQKAALSQIFEGFQRFVDTLVTYLLMSLFIILWSLLLVLPGVLAALSYALTFFLMTDHPDLKGREALRRSTALMKGNRWKLFCLFLRFFGWLLLGALSLGIGFLWIIPYMQTSLALFYDDLLGNSLSTGEQGIRIEAPVTPRSPQNPPEPFKVPRPAEPVAPAEARSQAPAARAGVCLRCHDSIPDLEAKSCPACGFPVMKVSGSLRTSPSVIQPIEPVGPAASLRSNETSTPRQIPLPRPLDLEATIIVGAPRLYSLSLEGQKEFYDLALPSVKIGRSSDNQLAFPDEMTISGHHCEIYREGKDFYVRDLGSTNGVIVNTHQVESAPLAEGDEIKLGAKVFTFTRLG